MPISRGQEPRQLYRGGGIMNLEPRQEYGLGSIVKSVKKAVSGAAKGIKSLAKSDVGKMALLLGGGYLAGGGGMPSFLGGRGLGGFQFSNLPGASLFSKSSAIGGPKYNLGGFGATGANKGMSGLTKGLIGGGALTALLGAAEAGDQEAIAATRDIGALKGYLSSYYENLGYKEEEIPAMVDRDTAEYSSSQGGYANGGRIGAMYGGRMKYGDGTPYVEPDPAMMVDTTTFNPIPENADRQEAAEIAKVMMATRGLPREEGEIEDTETMSTEDFMLNEYFKPKREELMEN